MKTEAKIHGIVYTFPEVSKLSGWEFIANEISYGKMRIIAKGPTNEVMEFFGPDKDEFLIEVRDKVIARL